MHTYKHICISTCIHICTYALIYFLSVPPASYRMTTRRRVLATRKALRTSKVFRTFLIHFSSADYLSTFVHICFFTISTAKVLCADFCSLHGFFFCIYTYTCTQTYLHAYTRIRLHIYTYTFTYTYTYTYTWCKFSMWWDKFTSKISMVHMSACVYAFPLFITCIRAYAWTCSYTCRYSYWPRPEHVV